MDCMMRIHVQYEKTWEECLAEVQKCKVGEEGAEGTGPGVPQAPPAPLQPVSPALPPHRPLSFLKLFPQPGPPPSQLCLPTPQ